MCKAIDYEVHSMNSEVRNRNVKNVVPNLLDLVLRTGLKINIDAAFKNYYISNFNSKKFSKFSKFLKSLQTPKNFVRILLIFKDIF